MTLDELRAAVAAGTVDTVLLGFADMQGRFQGKRLVATTSSRRWSPTAPRRATTCWRSTSR